MNIGLRALKSRALTYLLFYPRSQWALVWKNKIVPRISTQITRLRISNSLTPAYLNKIGVREDSFCNCDHSSYGDINHIYLGCNRNVEKFNRFYLEISQVSHKYKHFTLLRKSRKELSNKILKRILAIGPLTKYD